MNTIISLTKTLHVVLSRILSEYRDGAMGVTYGEWVVINGMLEACGVRPRDFSDDPDYAAVLEAFGTDPSTSVGLKEEEKI